MDGKQTKQNKTTEKKTEQITNKKMLYVIE